MRVVSPHWSQRNVLGSSQIHLLLFSLVWAAAVYAHNDGYSSPKACYIGDENCQACDTCVNPDTNEECACLLLSGKPVCDMQCVGGQRTALRHSSASSKAAAASFGTFVIVNLGLLSFTLYYSWKRRQRKRRVGITDHILVQASTLIAVYLKCLGLCTLIAPTTNTHCARRSRRDACSGATDEKKNL